MWFAKKNIPMPKNHTHILMHDYKLYIITICLTIGALNLKPQDIAFKYGESIAIFCFVVLWRTYHTKTPTHEYKDTKIYRDI